MTPKNSVVSFRLSPQEDAVVRLVHAATARDGQSLSDFLAAGVLAQANVEIEAAGGIEGLVSLRTEQLTAEHNAQQVALDALAATLLGRK